MLHVYDEDSDYYYFVLHFVLFLKAVATSYQRVTLRGAL